MNIMLVLAQVHFVCFPLQKMTSPAKIPPKNNEKENVFIHSSDFAG